MALNAGHLYREQVGPEAHGRTVLEHMAAAYRHSTAETWAARIEAGEVAVDGAVATERMSLRKGQIVTWQRPPWDEPDVPRSYELLHEDAEIVVVAKPSGLPTMPGGGFSAQTLLTLVLERFPEATLMHRLGRGTSGIVLFARTPAAGAALQEAFRGRALEKTYRALATGVAAEDAYEIHTKIGPIAHPLLGTVHAASASGKASESRARVLERRAGETLFEVDILTGRPHQIRIHLASVGHPLVGDPLYLAGGKISPDTTALPGDEGYLLHAGRLAFVHPKTGQPVVFEAPPPPALRLTR